MNAQRKTAKLGGRRHSFVFLRSRPRNLLRLECQASGLVIHAARNNFSPRDKTAFVRYLAEEGFIPESYRGFCADGAELWPELEWHVQGTSSPPRPAQSRFATPRANAFMLRLMAYGFALWLVELLTLFLIRR